MSLFQKSVEKKYLNELNSALIDEKFTLFQNYFGNPEIQENIRSAKEEQFQEGFLRELFVTIFGYTLNPEPNFNLTTELKNISNSKKADGAILKNGDAIAVIELKSTITTDLDKIETQAFGYKNHHPKCVYVITSNFEKIRFYIQNAVDHIDFDLFTLTRPQFELMWLCLAKENLLNNVPLKIKNASVLQEENITKKLYADYSDFRAAIYNNLVKNNPETDKLLLFKKTQKLLDRFLFIFFAEDRLLVPPNSITQIIEKWKDDEAFGEAKPLYETFKSYFRVLNTGRPKRGEREEIFAYNGGLFQPDEVLDNISIDDELLAIHTLQLSEYDFETDVDVNILGHIFEHSLGEIENVQAEIKGEKVESQKTKRKKDGIFYTPKYITKYIVENTIGTLCDEKRNELQLIDEEYAKGRKNRKKDIVRALDKKLDDYRNWLLSLTILDPACGSGAFLNQALEFLITEHKKIDELRCQLLGGAIVFSDITADILEKNIYGVDINEESVEIAKLSLWLRTAQKGRKLNSLSNNIKCGNSLIDNPQVAGDKAFNWQNEFPEILSTGGFDVVIGNPPYVQLQSMGEMSNLLSKSGYLTYNKSADLYCLFYERGCQLLKPKGFLSYITSNKWLRVNYGVSLRKFLTTKVNPTILIDFPGIPVFADAVVDPHILILRKEPYQGKTEACAIKTNTVDLETVFELNKTSCKFSAESWTIMLPDEARKIGQMKLNGIKLKNLPITINYGIKTGYNEAFFIDEETRQKLIESDPKSAELIKPMLRGRDISPYGISGSEFLINVHNGLKDKNPPINSIIINDYPTIKNHLDVFYPALAKRGDKGDTPYNLRNCAYLEEFAKPKIMYPNMTSVFPFMYDETGFLSNDKSFILSAQDNTVSLLFLVAVFNSSLAKLWIWYYCPELGDNRREIRKVYFEHFPVPQANEEQTAKLEKLAKERIWFTADMQTLTSKFVRTIQRKFNFEIMTGKLQDWYLISYAEFIKELSKLKVKLSLSEEAEWEEYFTLEKQKAQTLKSEIAKTDKEIDQMVYELYGVTEEGFGGVEEEVKDASI
jgi:type I restriction-modification system DNA methylase subunit